MMRRALLKMLGLGAFSFPGAGGTPPEPAGYKEPSLPGQAAGTVNIFRGRLVIVFGPSGAVNGVFIYNPGTTPGAGNGPVLSGTESGTDPYTNAVQAGWVAYSSPGSGTWAALAGGALRLNFPAMFSAGTVTEPAAGELQIASGSVNFGDSPAVINAISAQGNDGINRQIQLAAEQLQIPATVLATASGTITFQDNITITGTTISAPNATAINFDVATIDLANGNLNLNMADPPNTAAVIAGTATQAQYNACLGGMLNSMKNRKLFA